MALPVVATDIRGCREEVIHGETGLLVPPRNHWKLAEALISLLTDHASASRMGSQGRARALNCFDEDKVIRRQIDAYYGLIQSKGLAP